MDAATKVVLVGAGIVGVLISLAVGVALGGLRRRRAAQGLPAAALDPRVAWATIGGAGLLSGLMIVVVALPVFPGVPPLAVVLAAGAVPWAGALAWGRLAPRLALVDRVARRANGGDLAGAIARLQARLDRDAAPESAAGPAPADAPFDPWAPPAAGATLDPTKAVRCNLMGILQARRDDWPAALGWFERAARLAPAEPTYRLNRGEALIMLGRPDEGFPLAVTAIAEVPPADPTRQVSFRLSLARTLLDAGHRTPARDVLDEAAAGLRAAALLKGSVRSGLAGEIAGVRARLLAPLPAAGRGVPG